MPSQTPSPAGSCGIAECEDAAVISHDQIRAAAEAENFTVLSLDTHCFRTVGQPITAEGEE